MAKKLTAMQLEARFQALEEASEHLRMNWTDDPIEAEEGNKMADWLQTEASKWLRKADEANNG